jgi:hypothetical protein
MDALKIGFETIIVGALALPWIFLIIDLFCPSKESLFERAVACLKDQNLAAAAGVLLFAMAYLLGSSVARVAEDFLKDEDPGFGVTEDTIRTAVYCRPRNPWLIETGGVLRDRKIPNQSPALNGVLMNEESITINGEKLCAQDPLEAENNVRQTFALQESSLLSGPNTPDRVRYLHQQIVVLRGVLLDCTLVTVLCLFGLCAVNGRRGKIVLTVLSIGLFGWAVRVTFNHIHRLKSEGLRLVGEPPLLEGFLFTVAIAGLCLAYRGARTRSYGCGLIFAALMTSFALAGWWYGEIVYDQTVIYFFAASTNVLHAAGH